MNGFVKSGVTLALTVCACATAYAHAHLLQSASVADAVVTLGFKNAKNLEAIEVTDEYPGGLGRTRVMIGLLKFDGAAGTPAANNDWPGPIASSPTEMVQTNGPILAAYVRTAA